MFEIALCVVFLVTAGFAVVAKSKQGKKTRNKKLAESTQNLIQKDRKSLSE